MKRHWVFALAAVVVFPCLAQAQSDPGWGPTFRVTPFIGLSPGIKQRGEAIVFNSDGTATVNRYELDYSSSLPFGVNVEARVWDRFSVIAGGAYARRGDGKYTDFEQEEVYEVDGSNYWLAKAGIAMRLRENDPDLQMRRLNAAIFIAPAFIHDVANQTPFSSASASGAINHWGLNIGAEAELPMPNNRLAFQVGLEDWMLFWETDSHSQRVTPYVRAFNPAIEDIALDPSAKTHLWILRMGLSFRF